MISLISALVAEVQPLDFPLASGGLSGTTIGPATSAFPLCMWAPVAGRVMFASGDPAFFYHRQLLRRLDPFVK